MGLICQRDYRFIDERTGVAAVMGNRTRNLRTSHRSKQGQHVRPRCETLDLLKGIENTGAAVAEANNQFTDLSEETWTRDSF